ncbi:hypothetical protein TNCV_4442201 [Trichonephila clavipes]|nr:hypothetical protein TNCV_4442201 [Trichonephila clavipes]
MQVEQIGESLLIWVEAMRPLENADKNGWTMGDFYVMMVAYREDRLIVRSAITAPNQSLSIIRCATRTRVITMIVHRRLLERNLRSC